MSDQSNDYPDPDCSFGVAVRQDIKYIKRSLGQILKAQEDHTETLENGLTTKVERIDERLEDIETTQETKKERSLKKELREQQRGVNFKRELVMVFLTNVLAIGGGILIAYLSFG
mgnify:CR=1 FL=1